VEQPVQEYAIEFPAHGQVRASNELRKLGVFVSPTAVRGIWLRHQLANFNAEFVCPQSQHFPMWHIRNNSR